MNELIRLRQVRVATVAIGASTLRNQGAPKMVARARTFLKRLDLTKFSVTSQAEFQNVLNERTRRLARSFPGNGRGNWGAARKALNIFLRDAVESRSLLKHYQLARIKKWLEVPLDQDVANGLRGFQKDFGRKYPWPRIINLKSDVSKEYQRVASTMAKKLGCTRAELDLYLWKAN